MAKKKKNRKVSVNEGTSVLEESSLSSSVSSSQSSGESGRSCPDCKGC